MPNALSKQVLSAGQHADKMADYMREGEARALRLGNRGSIKLDAAGKLEQSILDAYLEYGFYVFEEKRHKLASRLSNNLDFSNRQDLDGNIRLSRTKELLNSPYSLLYKLVYSLIFQPPEVS